MRSDPDLKKVPSSKRILSAYFVIISIVFLICCRFRFFAEHAEHIKPYSGLVGSGTSLRPARDKNRMRILFLGDSSLFAPLHTKDDPRPTPGLLEEILSRDKDLGMQIEVTAWSFLGAHMFHYYCMLDRAAKASPDLIIIPIDWVFLKKDSNRFPEMSGMVPLFMRNPAGVNPLRLKGISPFRHMWYEFSIYFVYPIGLRAWAQDSPEEAPLERELQKIRDGGKNFLNEHYPMDISDTDENCLILKEIVDFCMSKNLNVLFYISPINCEYLQSIGHFDGGKFEASKKVLMRITKGKGIYCVDLSELLSDDDFWDMRMHYFSPGRKKVAESLAPKVLEILSRQHSG